MIEKNRISGRLGAFWVLMRVEEGSYANLLVNKMLNDDEITPLDRGLFSELVNGVLKNQEYLDFFLQHWMNRPFISLKPAVKTALRLGLYQLRFLDGVPSHAAVMESVELVKEPEPHAVGFVNAVLRRGSKQEDFTVKSKKGKAGLLSVNYSHPLWLVQRWVKRFGLEETQAILQSNQEKPPVFARCNTLKITPQGLAEKFDKSSLNFEISPFLPEAFILKGPLSDYITFINEGLISIQDIGTMIISKTLNPAKGQKLLDMCAAPGGKSGHLAALMENQGHIDALELHQGRAELMAKNLRVLGVEIVESHVQDATQVFGTPKSYDKVLLDAPCSGTGVLGRKPDARRTKSYEQILELAELQKKLLKAGFAALKPGGQMLYSTCSLEWEENEKNVEWFLAQESKAKLKTFTLGLEEEIKGEMYTIFPHKTQGDGFFMALIEKAK